MIRKALFFLQGKRQQSRDNHLFTMQDNKINCLKPSRDPRQGIEALWTWCLTAALSFSDYWWPTASEGFLKTPSTLCGNWLNCESQPAYFLYFDHSFHTITSPHFTWCDIRRVWVYSDSGVSVKAGNVAIGAKGSSSSSSTLFYGKIKLWTHVQWCTVSVYCLSWWTYSQIEFLDIIDLVQEQQIFQSHSQMIIHQSFWE